MTIIFIKDKNHEPQIKLDDKYTDLQDMDRLIRTYPLEALDVLMSCRNMGARKIMNLARQRVRKKPKLNRPGAIHHIQGLDDMKILQRRQENIEISDCEYNCRRG